MIEAIDGAPTDPVRIRASVEKFTFSRQTGRCPGVADATNPKRKGLVGDWRNQFTREACEVFDRVCGDLLVELGYEANRDWFRTLPAETDLQQSRSA